MQILQKIKPPTKLDLKGVNVKELRDAFPFLSGLVRGLDDSEGRSYAHGLVAGLLTMFNALREHAPQMFATRPKWEKVVVETEQLVLESEDAVSALLETYPEIRAALIEMSKKDPSNEFVEGILVAWGSTHAIIAGDRSIKLPTVEEEPEEEPSVTDFEEMLEQDEAPELRAVPESAPTQSFEDIKKLMSNIQTELGVSPSITMINGELILQIQLEKSTPLKKLAAINETLDQVMPGCEAETMWFSQGSALVVRL